MDLKELFATARAQWPVMWEECDSPIENTFLWEFQKVASERVHVLRQLPCLTKIGEFRVDFVIRDLKSSRKIAIECDGRDFHDLKRDARRDAAIIDAGLLDRIYRLSGSDIHWRIHDLLQLLSVAEPWILSDRGRSQLEVLAAAEHTREDTWGYFSDTMHGGVTRTIEPPGGHEGTFLGMVSIRWTPYKR